MQPESDPERKVDRGFDEQLIHVMSHRLRVQALTVLSDRIASPKEIAKQLGARLSVVSHHVKELLNAGLIELVDEQPRRGTVEHFYRSILRPLLGNEEWEKLSLEERKQFSAWIVQLVMGDIAKAMDAGTFDARMERHATRVPLYVDEEGWRELVQIHATALDAEFQVQAASAERMAKSGEDGFHVSASILCMEVPAPQQRPRD